MAEERLTDDLLKQLLAADRPEDYLDHEQLVSQELTDYREPLRISIGMGSALVVRCLD